MEKFKPEQLQFSDKAISHFSRMLEKEITQKWFSSAAYYGRKCDRYKWKPHRRLRHCQVDEQEIF